METFNSDPKPGRLILPLVLIGMIATTYTFINRVVENNDLEIIEDAVIEDTIPVVNEETTTSISTTTTIPEEVVAYLEKITGEKIQAIEIGKKVLETNQRWDDKIITYQEAQQEFQDFIDVWLLFSETVIPPPPSSEPNLVSNHEELVILVNLIYEDTLELLEGLTAPDTGQRRSAALDSFNNNLDLYINKIEQIVASATSS